MTYLALSPLALAIALVVPPVVPAVADDDAEAEALYQVVRELHTALAVNDSAAYRRLFAPLYVSLHMDSVQDPLAWKPGFNRTLDESVSTACQSQQARCPTRESGRLYQGQAPG